jgi:hypothetical protein
MIFSSREVNTLVQGTCGWLLWDWRPYCPLPAQGAVFPARRIKSALHTVLFESSAMGFRPTMGVL